MISFCETKGGEQYRSSGEEVVTYFRQKQRDRSKGTAHHVVQFFCFFRMSGRFSSKLNLSDPGTKKIYIFLTQVVGTPTPLYIQFNVIR